MEKEKTLKHPEIIKDAIYERHKSTKLSCLIGIFSNIFLFIMKVFIGLLAKSVSILSDAFNNLSDSLSFIIALVGLHYASKPADKEHPFGHGRVEYIVSFIVTILIFVAGFEFMVESYKRIINPTVMDVTSITFVLLIVTIIVKVLLAKHLERVGNKINNLALIASGKDSRNDVLITSVVLIAMITYRFNKQIPIDGIAGIIVSIFIFISGYDLAKSTITRLLGSQVDEKLLSEIKNDLLNINQIKGVHDLIVHDYGPNVKMGSGHVEMSNSLSLDEAHRIIDERENIIREKYGVDFTIHIDPVNESDYEYVQIQRSINETLKEIDNRLSIHDLLINDDTKSISFDVVLPFDKQQSHDDLEKNILEVLKDKYNYSFHISFDRGYTVERK